MEEDRNYLSRLLKDGESYKIEVKLSMDGIKDNVAKAMCGMANQRGGKVIVGLAERKFYKPEMGSYSEQDIIGGEFIAYGVKNPDRARLDLSSHLRQQTNLGTDLHDLYSISEITINDKKIVIIKVKPYFKDNNKIVIYKNEILRRIDNQTVKLTMADVANWFNVDNTTRGSSGNDVANMFESIDETNDPVYDAMRVVIEANKASTSLLQRRLRIGYGKASRLIDRLEESKIIGPRVKDRPREVLVDDIETARNLISSP